MEQALEKRSKDYSKQSENLRNLAKSIRQQFKRVREKDPEPSAKVLSKKECLDTIAQSTPQMNSVHIMSPRFPNITYNEGISKRLKRGRCHNALRDHLKKTGNRLFYLTALNLETAYNRARDVTKNPKKA